MFKIYYRITGDIEYIKSLNEKDLDFEGDFDGFFMMDFNGSTYGDYDDINLQREGFELLTNWFTLLLQAYIELCKSNYVAVSDIDSYNTWIEFKLDNNILNISHVKSEKKDGSTAIKITPFEEYEYGEWSNIKIDINEFRKEIITKSNLYLEDIFIINKKLVANCGLTELRQLIDNVNADFPL